MQIYILTGKGQEPVPANMNLFGTSREGSFCMKRWIVLLQEEITAVLELMNFNVQPAGSYNPSTGEIGTGN